MKPARRRATLLLQEPPTGFIKANSLSTVTPLMQTDNSPQNTMSAAMTGRCVKLSQARAIYLMNPSTTSAPKAKNYTVEYNTTASDVRRTDHQRQNCPD